MVGRRSFRRRLCQRTAGRLLAEESEGPCAGLTGAGCFLLVDGGRGGLGVERLLVEPVFVGTSARVGGGCKNREQTNHQHGGKQAFHGFLHEKKELW